MSPAPANHQLTSMENRRQTCGTKTSFFLHPAFFAAGRKASAEFCMARQLPACVGTCPLAVPWPAMQRYSWVLSPFQIPAEKRLAALRQAGRFSFPQAGEKSFPEPPSQRPAGRIAAAVILLPAHCVHLPPGSCRRRSHRWAPAPSPRAE